MTPDAACEYSESIGQIGSGWWRQIAWAQREGVPKTLGLTNREWAERYHGYLKLPVSERRDAVAELSADFNNCEIADVLGVSEPTVRRDKSSNDEDEEKSLEAQGEPISSNDEDEEEFREVDDEAEEEGEEERRLRELQEVNNETQKAKLYASLFYMPAREITCMLDDGETADNIVLIMRRRRYVLKVDVTPSELRKAGEMFLRLAKQETKR